MKTYKKMPQKVITLTFKYEPMLPFMEPNRPIVVELTCADDPNEPMIVLLADLATDPINYAFVDPNDFTNNIMPTEVQIAVAQQIIQTFKDQPEDNN